MEMEKEGIRSNMYRIPLYFEKHSKMEPPLPHVPNSLKNKKWNPFPQARIPFYHTRKTCPNTIESMNLYKNRRWLHRC